MDKVKLFLAGLKKYHFWVLVSIVVVVGLMMWATATADLASQFAKRQGKLDSDFSSVRNIITEHDPPNQGVVEAIQTVHQDLKEKVLEAWEKLYTEQKQNNPWSPVLGEDFLIVVKSLGPKDDIPRQYRELYQNFIRDHFPRLLEMIDVRRPEEPEEGATGAAAAAGGMMGEGSGHAGAMGANVEMIGKVEWDESDRQRIQNWFEWPSRPSTLQVRLAQEDLWVYEALLRIVKNTNAGATSYYNSAVKRIESLEIGQEVSHGRSRNRTDTLVRSSGGKGAGGAGAAGEAMGGAADMMGEGGGQMGAPGGDMGMGMEGEPGGMGGPRGTGAANELAQQILEGRYVDDKGNPLTADAKSPYAEFKMMPIRMVLVMDQRKLPRLLVECANSSMPVEVRQVGINPGQGARIDFSRLGSGGSTSRVNLRSPGGHRGGEMDMGMEGGHGGPAHRGGRGGMLGGASGGEYGSFDIPVEIAGIIYIFNPPDRDKLGTGAAADQPPEGALPTTPPAPPAAAPAAPAVPAAAPAAPPAAATPAAPPPAATPAAPPAAATPPAPAAAAPAAPAANGP